MDKYQESLIKSMELLAGSMDKKSQGTGTYEGTIVDIIDDESYYVDFRGNKLRCYTSNISLKYSIGERVIFIVPQNDFTEHKTIVGSSTPGSTTYDQEADMAGWVNVSGNLLKGKNKDDIYKLSTYRDSEDYFLNSNSYNGEIALSEFDIKILNQYIINQYTNFKLGIKLFTSINGANQAYGNYGIRLKLNYKMLNERQDTGIKIVTLDNDNVLGNPYKQEDPNYTEQGTIFKIDQSMRIESGSIQFFTEGFPEHKEIVVENDCDIYIKDIQLNALDSIANVNGIHLNIVSDNGYYLTRGYSDTNADDIYYTELNPYLLVNGEVVDLDSDAVEDISWYEEDDRIDSHSPYYREEAGIQWKCINKIETLVKEGKETSDINEDSNTGEPVYNFLTKQKSAVAAMSDLKPEEEASLPSSSYALVYLSKRIKCVLKYKGAYIAAEVNIINIDKLSDLNIYLYTKNGQLSFSPALGDVHLVCELKGDDSEANFGNDSVSLTQFYYYWTLYNRNMKKVSDTFFDIVELNTNKGNESIITEIKFPTHMIDDYCFVKVSAYFPLTDVPGTNLADANSDLLIGSKTIAISTDDELNYVLGVENADPLYKYDKDGDSPLTGDIYDGPASSKINYTKPMLVHIYNKDGTEIDDDNYNYATYEWRIPKNSLIESNEDKWDDSDDEYYYWKGSGNDSDNNYRQLRYIIAKKFKRDKNDNTILLKVEYDGVILNQLMTIQFIKDYFDGIEGSKYSLFLQLDEGSTGNAGGELYAYEQKDKEGIHKLRFYKINGSWYFTFSNYGHEDLLTETIGNSNKLKWKWDEHKSSGIQFKLNLYRDGELASVKSANVECKWFGDDGCFDKPVISQENESSAITITIKKEAGALDENKTNILQVSYKVSSGGGDNKKDYKLYCYYPIEFIVIDKINTEADIIKNFNLAPTLDYGFYNVIYSSEGVNPQYDYAYDYKLNYGDIIDSYFSNEDTQILQNNYINKTTEGSRQLYWEGNTDNFDTTQKIIKPAQKYNRNNLNNKVKLINWKCPNSDRIRLKIDEIETDLADNYAYAFQWSTDQIIWERIQSYINTIDQWADRCKYLMYLRNTLVNREDSNKLINLSDTFYAGLKNIFNTSTMPSQGPLIDFKDALQDIYKNIENKTYKYDYLVNNFVNPLKNIFNTYFTQKENNLFDFSEALNKKYKDEFDKYDSIRQRLEAEKVAYNNLKVLSDNFTMTLHQPVAFIYDVEMLAEIENYDGTQKIEGLQIINNGTGIINNNNKFSGLALGSQKEQGYFIGYCNGTQTFRLDNHGNLTLLDDCGHGGNLKVEGSTSIYGTTDIYGQTNIHNRTKITGNTTISGNVDIGATYFRIYDKDIDDDEEYNSDDYGGGGGGSSDYDSRWEIGDDNWLYIDGVKNTQLFLDGLDSYEIYLQGSSIKETPGIKGENYYYPSGTQATWSQYTNSTPRNLYSFGKTKGPKSSSGGDGDLIFEVRDDMHSYGNTAQSAWIKGLGVDQKGPNTDVPATWIFGDGVIHTNGYYAVINGSNRTTIGAGTREVAGGGDSSPTSRPFVYSHGGGVTYIDGSGNFVSPNLRCRATAMTGSTPGLGLGIVESSGGYSKQLIIADSNIENVGKITTSLSTSGDTALIFGGIKNLNNGNTTTAPRLKISKGTLTSPYTSPYNARMVSGWIRFIGVNNKEYNIYIHDKIALPVKSISGSKEYSFNGCSCNATQLSYKISYTIEDGNIATNTPTIIKFLAEAKNGTAECGESCECDCPGCECGGSCECEYDEGEAHSYAFSGKTFYWDYNNGAFSWNISEITFSEISDSQKCECSCDCDCEPCEEEGE